MTKIEELKRSVLDKIKSYTDVESIPFLLIYPEKYKEWTQIIYETNTKDFPNILLEEAKLFNAITTMGVVFTYSDDDSKLMPQVIDLLLKEHCIVEAIDAEEIEKKKVFPSGRRFDKLFPYTVAQNVDYLFVKAVYSQESLKRYKDFHELQKLFYSGHFTFFRYEINWAKLKAESQDFDYYQPITLDIGIKSQKKASITLYPKLEKDPIYTLLSYKYSDYEPISITFEFNKGFIPLALLSLFLYSKENSSISSILNFNQAKEVLLEYNIPVRKSSSSDMRRIMKYLHEKIKKVTNERARNHLLNIFPVKGDFLRLETSLELSGAQSS